MSTPTVKQLPLSPNLAQGGLTSQRNDLGLLDNNNVATNVGQYVAQNQTPVVVTRNSEGLTQNPVNGNLSLVAVDEPAFGDIGLQIGRQTVNSLSNSDARNGTTGYTLVDTGGIVTTFDTVASGIDESDTALHLVVDNTSGFVQFVEIYQTISGALSGESWGAQASLKFISGATQVAGTLVRIVDQDNVTITSNNVPPSLERFTKATAVQTLIGNSNDLRCSIQFQVPDTVQYECLITNTSLVLSPWPSHYVPSASGPTTRESDVVDVGSAGIPFFTHAVDEMWSIDFNTLGTLATVVGASQLQYLFSTYNGVDGTSLFVDDVDTITWQADFNGSLEDVTLVVAGLGADPHRAYMRTLDDGGGGYDRQLFVENLTTGAITASTVLNTTNLPIQGDVMKLGRDNADANILDGFLGRLILWGNRSDLSMNRINDNWPTP
jgi:hypothetical protein